MNGNKFIVEQYVDGDEFAMDAYFNQKGEPVILGIFKHLFSSATDVSDRIYYTSKDIIESLKNVELIETRGIWIGILDDVASMLKNESMKLEFSSAC